MSGNNPLSSVMGGSDWADASPWALPPWGDSAPIISQIGTLDGLRTAFSYWKTHLRAASGSADYWLAEQKALEWIYRFIRLNVKRGRYFELEAVIRQRSADCLGYSLLFTHLSRYLGLQAGVIEIVIDNCGNWVPHTAVLAKLADGSRQVIDLWYGSRNIHHRRFGLSVKRNHRWQVTDLDWTQLSRVDDIGFLPDTRVEAIRLYITGNRYLSQSDYPNALECYTRSITLYPQNARTYYNRAIVFEKLGRSEEAGRDYTRALTGRSAQIRTLAVQPPEVVNLIRLDELNIPEPEQTVYLLSRGFITGHRLSAGRIAAKTGQTPDQIRRILAVIKKQLHSTPAIIVH